MTASVTTPTLRFPSDTQILPVARLRADVRRSLECLPDDYVVTRPTGRARSLLVDRDAASFITEFRRPSTLAGAVLRHATATAIDPERLLDQITPLIRRLVNLGLLVPGDADTALTFRLERGDRLGGWTVTGRIQTLEDSEVYRGLDGTGREAAIKVARRPGDLAIAAALSHESSVLAKLHGLPVATVLEDRTDAEWPYLAVEWVSGDDSLVAANRARGDSAQLVKLCIAVADAFAQLHERGVVHGDVHPKNVILSTGGGVTLIDFGLARILAEGAGPSRQGVGYFFEPEYARAALGTAPLPPATPEGETYAVAALCYLLLTGSHYLEFPLQRRAFLEAIVHGTPTPLHVHGVDDRPMLERALRGALAKEPDGRTSCRVLADALAHAERPHKTCPTPPARDVWTRYRSSRSAAEGVPRPPARSVHHGSAGVAYALLRLAQLSDDPSTLAAADLWLASEPGTGVEPFRNPSIGMDDHSMGRVSLHYGPFGPSIVRALIAHARWDPAAVNNAVRDVVAEAEADSDRVDLVSGLAGVLVGLAHLAEVLPVDRLIERAPLVAAGHRIAERLAERDPRSPRSEWPVGMSLGVAHGLAGSLYARLRWSEATHCLPGEGIEDQLAQLAGYAETDGERMRWPDRVGHPANKAPFGAGWCNGAAGHALLFSLATRVYPSRGFGDIAVAASHEAWLSPDLQPSLCCGLAGRTFAVLEMARLTGDTTWRGRAERMAEDITLPHDTPATPTDSLYKGALGIHLLRKELSHAQVPVFPLFSSEGWARRDRMSEGLFREGTS